jgi:hypothetical protein
LAIVRVDLSTASLRRFANIHVTEVREETAEDAQA